MPEIGPDPLPEMGQYPLSKDCITQSRVPCDEPGRMAECLSCSRKRLTRLMGRHFHKSQVRLAMEWKEDILIFRKKIS